MSSAMTGLRRYTVSCPSCGTAATVEDCGPDTTERRTCAGCGNRLVIIRTDTMCMAAIPASPAPGTALAGGPGAAAAGIADFWNALASHR